MDRWTVKGVIDKTLGTITISRGSVATKHRIRWSGEPLGGRGKRTAGRKGQVSQGMDKFGDA